MKFQCLRGTALAALLMVVSGCRYGEELFDQSDAEVDPRSVFPSFAATTETSPDSSWDFAPCNGDSASKRLRLTDLFAAQLPAGDGWAWAESGQATILLHSRGGETLPSAFLYAEKTDQKSLGTGLQSFHQLIDQRIGKPSLPSLSSWWKSFRAPANVSTKGLEASGNLPPGYSSDEGTFSGWRWLGECVSREGDAAEAAPKDQPVEADELKPFLRLSRSHGNWRRLPGSEPEPALLILATVTLPDRRNYGVHLAIVCRQVPQCEEAEDFALLLGSLRVSAAGRSSSASRNSRMLQELAEEVGISLLGSPADDSTVTSPASPSLTSP